MNIFNTLRGRLITVAISGIIIAVAVVFWQMDYLHKQEAAISTENQILRDSDLLKLSMDSTFINLYNQQFAFTRDPALKAVLRTHDGGKAAKVVAHSYKRLKADRTIAALGVYDARGGLLTFLPKSGAFDGRQLAARVLREQKIIEGLVRGNDGMPYATLAFPIYDRSQPGRPVGVVALGQSAAFMLNKLRTTPVSAFGLRDDHGRLIFSTMSALKPGDAAVAATPLPKRTPRADRIRVADRTLEIVQVPLHDQAGRVIGAFLAIDDVTKLAHKVNVLWWMTFGESIVLILVVALLILWMVNRTVRPIHEAENALRKIADGDLSQPFRQRDVVQEVAVLLELIEQLRQKVHESIARVVDASGTINEAARETEQAAVQIFDDLQQEHRSIETVDTAVQRMVNFSKQVADQVRAAADAAKRADAEAHEGSRVLDTAIRSIDSLADDVLRAAQVIDRLREESETINNILSVIQEIAEQTNLLALNAAIEAARAGEHGRGFAVVADEVRSLASRTQNSVQEIEQIIQRLQAGTAEAVKVMTEAQQQAQTSVDNSAQVNEKLQQIVSVVAEIAEENANIAHSSEQQADEVSNVQAEIKAIYEKADAICNLADNSQEKARAMAELAEQLRQLVRHFKV